MWGSLTRGCARDMLDEYGVRLNVIGKTSLLPPAVQAAVAQAESMSRHNSKYVSARVHRDLHTVLTRLRAILNVHMPYAARNEITDAVNAAVHDALATGGPTRSVPSRLTPPPHANTPH